jgi:hypothetical protein
MKDLLRDEFGAPKTVDRSTFQAQLDALRTVYGRQEMWEDTPTGWPQRFKGKQVARIDGRPTAQWSQLKAGYSDDLGTGRR